MKKNLFIAAAILLAIVSCQKSRTYRVEVTDENAAETPQAVEFTTNLRANVITKGQGTLEDVWTGKEDLFIIGVEKNKPFDADANFLINNISADSPTSGTSGAIHVYRDKLTQEKYYYAEKVYYDFYGYYVDDAAVGSSSIQYKDTSIFLPVTINGTQDILLAKADPAKDTVGSNANLDISKVYSATASRKGIKPNLVFEHQLARFDFKIKQGSSLSAADAAKITIEGLQVTSKSKGDLYIANSSANGGTGLRYFSEPTKLKVCYKDKNDSNKLKPIDHSREIHPTADADTLGVPVMVIPGDAVYDLSLQLIQNGYTTDATDDNDAFDVEGLKIDFAKLKVGEGQTKDTVAVAGHKYVVTIIINGLSQVDITVELKPWEDGGEFEIDPDEDDEETTNDPGTDTGSGE